jgi:hypothetical protein
MKMYVPVPQKWVISNSEGILLFSNESTSDYAHITGPLLYEISALYDDAALQRCLKC